MTLKEIATFGLGLLGLGIYLFIGAVRRLLIACGDISAKLDKLDTVIAAIEVLHDDLGDGDDPNPEADSSYGDECVRDKSIRLLTYYSEKERKRKADEKRGEQ